MMFPLLFYFPFYNKPSEIAVQLPVQFTPIPFGRVPKLL
jgi:hypothetical protein